MARVKIGIVGCGNYGINLINFLNQMQDRFEIAAVCDTSPEALMNAASLANTNERYDDYRALLAQEGLQAVIIATPNDEHAAQALDVMKSGKCLYLEKPIGCTVEDCQKVVLSQRETGAKVMVGMQLRYGSVFVKAKQLLDEGIIGAVKLVWYKEFRGPFNPGADGWRVSMKRSGGVIVEKNVHHFDLFNSFIGAVPVSAFASAGSDAVYKDIQMLDNALMVFDYENGARACCGLSLFSAGCDDDIDFYIVAEKGVMEIGRDVITVKPNTDKSQTILYKARQEHASMGHGGTEYSALSAFHEMITLNKPPLTGVREGMLSVGMAIAAQVSAAEHRIVRMDEITKRSMGAL